jgi:hypothetical protein
MKKLIFILISVSVFSTVLCAQDLVVLNIGDSLNCHITKIESENIFFSLKNKGKVSRNLMPLSIVKYYKIGYFEIPDTFDYNRPLLRFRTAINLGFGYRTGHISESVASDYVQYVEGLKSGFHYGLDFSYTPHEQLYYGLKFNCHRAKNDISNISDDISIYFLGPFFGSRYYNLKKDKCLLFNMGLGYVGYLDKCEYSYDFKIKGSTIGACWDLGYDIDLSRKFALGFQVSYMVGVLTQYKTIRDDHIETYHLRRNEYENLSHVDLSVGIRFKK